MLKRNFYLIVVLVILPLLVLLYQISPDLSLEQELSQKLAETQMRMQYLESLYRVKQEDLSILSQYLGLSINSTANTNILQSLSPESRNVIRNITRAQKSASALRLPTSFHFLPHLLNDEYSLRPSYLLSRGKSDVSIVLGVPTVKREKQSYLIGTLDSLITSMNEEEQNETLIIVFIGETDLEYVQLVAKEIEIRFNPYVESGLIEVLSPSPNYYPDMEKLRITLNDPLERVKWRSKQNLDFAYMMAYAQPKATFYVQLEDDILAKRGFISTMKNFALDKTAKKDSTWFVLDFCQLGFIGKMFKSVDLPWLITYFQMFYNDQPVDWLLDHLIYTKICNWDKDMKHCKAEKQKVWIHYKPSLFQHIGTTSSLKGKVQKLKDKQFGKIPNFYPHPQNPPAKASSNVAAYKSYTLQRAYNGETFFWGLLPQPDDVLEFKFLKPATLKKFLFRSGNVEHPSDKFYNTTVEIDPVTPVSSNSTKLNLTADGYVVVGYFNTFGIAEGALDAKFGKIKSIRLHVHGDTENWVILSEILLKEEYR